MNEQSMAFACILLMKSHDFQFQSKTHSTDYRSTSDTKTDSAFDAATINIGCFQFPKRGPYRFNFE